MKFLEFISGTYFYQNDEREIAEYGFSITVLNLPYIEKNHPYRLYCTFTPEFTLAKFDTLESAVEWYNEHSEFHSSRKELWELSLVLWSGLRCHYDSASSDERMIKLMFDALMHLLIKLEYDEKVF